MKYKKGQNWLANNFVPRREVILQDFNQMKDLGFNTVQYSGPGIYDQNVLTYSKKVGLSLVYSFWIPHNMNFVTDSIGKQELRQRILTAIKHYKEYDNIIAWDIGNDTWRELENTFNQPVLSYQRKAYMSWLSELTAAIKETDRSRPLLLSMHLDEQSIKRIREMRIVAPQIDAYGMITGESAPFTSFIKQAENDNIPFTISDISVGIYKSLQLQLQGQAIVIGNWQDQWESDLVSFDGLLDFEGRKKEAFYELEGVWSDRVFTRPDLDFRILKPSRLLYPGDTNTYHLVLRDNDKWVDPQKNLYEDRFEWYLVKTDEYGNKLGLKELGKGLSKTIKIPAGHEFYELMVSYFVHDMVSSRITSLNTPLEP